MKTLKTGHSGDSSSWRQWVERAVKECITQSNPVWPQSLSAYVPSVGGAYTPWASVYCCDEHTWVSRLASVGQLDTSGKREPQLRSPPSDWTGSTYGGILLIAGDVGGPAPLWVVPSQHVCGPGVYKKGLSESEPASQFVHGLCWSSCPLSSSVIDSNP